MASHPDALEQGDLVCLREELLEHFCTSSGGEVRRAMFKLLNRMSPDHVIDYERVENFLRFLTEAEDHYGDFRKNYEATLPSYIVETLTYFFFADDDLADPAECLSKDAQQLFEDVMAIETAEGGIPQEKRYTTAAFVYKLKRLEELGEFYRSGLSMFTSEKSDDLARYYREELAYSSYQPLFETDALSTEIRERENHLIPVINNYSDDPYHSPFWMYPFAAKNIGERHNMEIYETRKELDMPDSLKPHYDSLFRFFAARDRGDMKETFIAIAQEAVSPVYRLNLQAYERNFWVNERMRLLTFYSGAAFDVGGREELERLYGSDVSEAMMRLVDDTAKTHDLSDLPYDVKIDTVFAMRAYVHEALRRGIAECEDGIIEAVPTTQTYNLLNDMLKVAERIAANDGGTTEFFAICDCAGHERARLGQILTSIGELDEEVEGDPCVAFPSGDADEDMPDMEVEYGPVGINGQIMVPANDR